MHSYTVFGLNISSNYPFSHNLCLTDNATDLTFDFQDNQQPFTSQYETELVYTSPYKDTQEISYLYIFQSEDSVILRFANAMEFLLNKKGIRCRLFNQAYKFMVEINFLGTVLAFFLETQGQLCLHASANLFEGQVIAFAAGNKAGKSSLAMSLMQAGYPMITDDLLPVSISEKVVTAYSGYPQQRFWPDQVLYFYEKASFPIFHPLYDKKLIHLNEAKGEFCRGSATLSTLYFPERVEERGICDLIELKKSDALLQLLKTSYIHEIVNEYHALPNRLEAIKMFLSHVQTKRLIYSSGMEYIPQVIKKIQDDQNSCVKQGL